MAYPSSPGWKATGASREAANKITSHAKTVRDRVHFFLKDHYPSTFSADQIATVSAKAYLRSARGFRNLAARDRSRP